MQVPQFKLFRNIIYKILYLHRLRKDISLNIIHTLSLDIFQLLTGFDTLLDYQCIHMMNGLNHALQEISCDFIFRRIPKKALINLDISKLMMEESRQIGVARSKIIQRKCKSGLSKFS